MKNQKTRATILIILGVIVSIGLISYRFNEANAAQDEEPNTTEQNLNSTGENKGFVLTKDDLNLMEVKSADKPVEWPISGRVVPKNTTDLFSEVQGKVLSERFMLNEGLTFDQGQVLLQLDATEFSLQLEAQRSAFLNILTGMMPDLKADYPNNYEQWLGYIQAYSSGQSLAALPETKSEGEKYFVTTNKVYSTYYNIKASEERLSKFAIRAPYSGIVTRATVDKGSLVSPGQMLATIINNRSFELEGAASLEVANKLKQGDQIIFRSNEARGEWVGTVDRINDIIDPKTQNIPIYFEITGANLRAGMYLEGAYTGESLERVFAIPSSVLTRDEKVLLLEENTITGKEVELVEFMQDTILVRGLEDNAVIITNQFNVPVEGLKISQ
ncbi:MAG: HlyD family efflux transporter periplasmic adaptor subunit [Bacteroidota bacterium]